MIIRIVDLRLIDLSDDEGQYLQLKHAKILPSSMGFLPNGDLIVMLLNTKKLRDYKIYLYSFTNKPTNAILWEYSQIYDIKFHESLNEHNYTDCFILCQKLFLFNDGHLIQWDLLKMTASTTSENPEIQYNLFSEHLNNIVINKNKTLLATYDGVNVIYIYSMETGLRISRYG